MPEEEFQSYMNGDITSVSAWESALVACEGMHQLCEHLARLKGLSERTQTLQDGTVDLKEEMNKFKVFISIFLIIFRFKLAFFARSFLGLFRNFIDFGFFYLSRS